MWIRTLFGLRVAMAICSVERLHRWFEVCLSVYRLSVELMDVCGRHYIPSDAGTTNGVLCREIVSFKDRGPNPEKQGYYKRVFFSEEFWTMFFWSKEDEPAFTTVFYRLLGVWKERLPKPVLAFVAHVSAPELGDSM